MPFGLGRLTDMTTRHAGVVVLLSFLAVAAVLWGAGRLYIETDYRIYFGPENQELNDFERFENTFSKFDNLLFAIRAEEGDIFSADGLAALRRLTEEAWRLPHVRRVESVTNFQHSWAQGDALEVADLVPERALSDPEARARIREIALGEPLLRGRLVTTDGRMAGVNVTFHLPDVRNDEDEITDIVRQGRALARSIANTHPGLEVVQTGAIQLFHAFREASLEDLRTLFPLIVATIGGLLYLFVGSVRLTAAILTVVGSAMATGMGFAGWMGWNLNPTTSVAPVMIATIAVADGVHIGISVMRDLRETDHLTHAIRNAMRINFQPVFLTSLTTIVGFLTFNFSDAPPIRMLGNITAFGVAGAFVFSLTLLPALIVMFRTGPSRDGRYSWIVSEWLPGFVITHRRALMVSAGAISVVLIAQIPTLALNDQFVGYFDEDTSFRSDTDLVTDEMASVYQIDYALMAPDGASVTDPAYLDDVDRFADWLRRQPGVQHVASFSDIMRKLNRNMHGDDPAYDRLPEDGALAAQYLLLLEMSLPMGLDLTDKLNLDRTASRLTVALQDLTTAEVQDLLDRAAAWLAAETAFPTSTIATGAIVMFAHISERNIESMAWGTAIAFLVIAGLLCIAFRSFWLGIASMVPNFLPAAVAVGLWAVVVGQVGMNVSIVAAMTLGIVVDDTVHFLSKYRRARRELALAPEDAVRYAFATVGRALWVTSGALIAGFIVLAQSAFKINADMGLLTALTLVIALGVDFLLVPPILLFADRREIHSEHSP